LAARGDDVVDGKAARAADRAIGMAIGGLTIVKIVVDIAAILGGRGGQQ